LPDLIRHERLTVIATLHDLNHTVMFLDHIAIPNRGGPGAAGKPEQTQISVLIRNIFMPKQLRTGYSKYEHGPWLFFTFTPAGKLHNISYSSDFYRCMFLDSFGFERTFQNQDA